MPLNTHVILHWGLLQGFEEDRWHEVQTDLLNDKLVKWLKRKGWPVAFIWIKEVGSDKGAHTHIHAHLPLREGARHALVEFLTRAGPFLPQGSLGRNDLPIVARKAFNDRAARKLLRYLTKSLSPDAAIRTPEGPLRIGPACGIRHKPCSRPLTGKRCGTSKTLSPTARRRAGWRDMRTIGEVIEYLPKPKKEDNQ